jgi:hypothetical protein
MELEQEETQDDRGAFAAAMALREERERYLEVDGAAYPEEEEPARAALLELSRRLAALADGGFGDMAVDARVVWARSLLPLRSLEQIVAALRDVEVAWLSLFARSSGERALDVLSDLRLSADARADYQAEEAILKVRELLAAAQKDLRAERQRPAREQASVAREALVVLMDALRSRAPERLR